ncbi:circularly permuted type 2 ATP-grasp protein [Ramlibacter solisilvae]|nr:circularly permuted type 2 ATP-grasp protein [Ramlibacter tataouinensis]
MDKPSSPIAPASGRANGETPGARAASLAAAAAAGHFDELLGGESPAAAAGALPCPPWQRFFDTLGREGLGDLNRRTANLQRQVRDNGITYNVYADAHGPQRPWSLDLFPLLVAPESWERIEAGVLQRAALLERIMEDAYGPQQCLSANLLPPALVQGHPGFLRAMRGVRPAAGSWLHVVAFDLARDPQGRWWVVSQRTQAPSGLGYLLENRQIVARLFPEAFRELRVQRLADTYHGFVESLRAMCPSSAEPHIVLLTPGPYNETYFEHAFLARHLGLTLVEGSDLVVRDERLFLKTIEGLEPVHGILKRLDDEFLDPLEMRSDSQLGVPGLLQVIRAGHVLMANAPGSAFLESPGLLGFLPALSRRLLGEELALPSLPTWWCGERVAMQDALPQLARQVVKPTYVGAGSAHGPSLSPGEQAELVRRIEREPDEHTLQSWLPLAQMPTWAHGMAGDRIVPRSFMLRVFAVSSGPGAWRVLPGGLTRIASTNADIASMQRGGSSADTWVLSPGPVDIAALAPPGQLALHPAPRRGVTSRAAENLFWLGRYTERTENAARLAGLLLESLGGEEQASPPLLGWLEQLARFTGLAPADAPPVQQRRAFERTLIDALAKAGAASVGHNLRALRHAASAVRERLSQEHWKLTVRAEQEFVRGCLIVTQDGDHSPVEARRVLESLLGATAAMTGAQADRMMRDDGWRLLWIGRHIERLTFLASVLGRALEAGVVADELGFEAVVALFDGTATFHARYQQRHDMQPLLDLLVLDHDNPRSLASVANALRAGLARLEEGTKETRHALTRQVPEPQLWSMDALCEPGELEALAQRCTDAAYRLSDGLGSRYFTHSADQGHSVGV